MYIDDRSVSELQHRIMLALRAEPLTTDELTKRLEQMFGREYREGSVRSRCSELHHKNKDDKVAWLIMAHDFRMCRESHENKNSWALTPLGRDGLERLNKKP